MENGEIIKGEIIDDSQETEVVTNPSLTERVDQSLDIYPSIIYTETYGYSIENYALILRSINNAVETVKNYSIETDEDRVSLKKVTTLIGKYRDNLNRETRKYKEQLFQSLDMEMDQIFDNLNLLVTELKQVIDTAENQYRNEKRGKLIEYVQTCQTAAKMDKNVEPARLFNVRWLNRSITEKQARTEIDNIFEQYDILKNMLPSLDDETIINNLAKNGWNGLIAFQQLNNKPLPDKDIKYTAVKIKLPVKDMPIIENIVAKHEGWSFQ